MLTLTPPHPGDDVPVLAPSTASSALAARLEPSSSAVLALRAKACALDYRRGRKEGVFVLVCVKEYSLDGSVA